MNFRVKLFTKRYFLFKQIFTSLILYYLSILKSVAKLLFPTLIFYLDVLENLEQAMNEI